MKCGNCGNIITNSDEYCSECGYKLIRDNNKSNKMNPGKCILIGFIVSIILFIVPALIKVILNSNGVEIIGTAPGVILNLIEYVVPIMTIWLVPLILYLVCNKKSE